MVILSCHPYWVTFSSLSYDVVIPIGESCHRYWMTTFLVLNDNFPGSEWQLSFVLKENFPFAQRKTFLPRKWQLSFHPKGNYLWSFNVKNIIWRYWMATLGGVISCCTMSDIAEKMPGRCQRHPKKCLFDVEGVTICAPHRQTAIQLYHSTLR